MSEREELQEELDEREVEGVEKLPPDEKAAVAETAERNPDPTTKREAIEKELMDLDRSEAGEELGD